jgi:tetratricopeptide (TPR) repeat protein
MRGTGLILALTLASLAWPCRAAAQSAQVLRALDDLRGALVGSFGDERAEVARRLDDVSAAVATWDRAIRDAELALRARLAGATPADTALAHETLGAAYLERGRLADAVAEFEAASRLAPQRATPHLSRAFALDAMGGADRAAEAFRQAWTLDPDDPVTAYLALARSAIDGAELTRAGDTLARAALGAIAGSRARPRSAFPQRPAAPLAAGSAPLFPLARYADGFAMAIEGRLDEAVTRMRAAAASDPLIADPASRSENMRQAADELRRGSLRGALSALERVVAASPGSSEAHRMLGTATALAGDIPTSIAHLEAALRLRPDDERSWTALADIHADAGALLEAVRTLEQAVTVIPDSGGLRWRLAGLLVKADRNADALEHYEVAERLLPLSGRAQVHQAVAALASLHQDVGRATAASDRRVRGDLNDAMAHRDLAGLYAKDGHQDAALAELAIAAWLDPDDQLTLVVFGHSLMAGGRDADAVAALERAVLLQPDLREARYGLAQALMRIGRRDDARQHLAEFERQRAEAGARERRALDVDALKEEAARRSAAGQHVQAAGIWRKVIAIEPGTARNYLVLADTLVKAGAFEESLLYLVKAAELDGVADVHRRLADVLARLGRAKESALALETYERLRLQDFRARSTRPSESKPD